MTTEALGGLWHANCHGPLGLLHRRGEQRLLRPTSRKAWQSGYRCDTLHYLDLVVCKHTVHLEVDGKKKSSRPNRPLTGQGSAVGNMSDY